MKNTLKTVGFLLTLAAFCSLESCSLSYFANPAIDPIVFTKPVYCDSAVTSSYIGGKINSSTYNNNNYYYENSEKKQNFYGQAYVFQTRTEKYFSFSYGAFGYYGQIDAQTNSTLPNFLSYAGGGISSEINLNIPLKFIDIRPIGIKGTAYFEDGQFARYKDENYDQFYPDESHRKADRFAYSISYSTGLDIKIKNNSLGVSYSLGTTTTIPLGLTDLTYSGIINYSTPKLTFYLQKSGTLIMGHNDLIVGLNYRLP
jgi:hypothetical protein